MVDGGWWVVGGGWWVMGGWCWVLSAPIMAMNRLPECRDEDRLRVQAEARDREQTPLHRLQVAVDGLRPQCIFEKADEARPRGLAHVLEEQRRFLVAIGPEDGGWEANLDGL